jgi:hypothetical protein
MVPLPAITGEKYSSAARTLRGLLLRRRDLVDPELESFLIKAFAQVGERDGAMFDLLSEIVNEKRGEETPVVAAKTLSMLGDPQNYDRLKNWAKDTGMYVGVRTASVEGLVKLARSGPGPRQEVLDLCQELFKDRTISIVDAALLGFSHLATPKQADRLLDFLAQMEHHEPAATAIARILQRHPKTSGDFVLPYLHWLIRRPATGFAFEPSSLFEYFSRVADVDVNAQQETPVTIMDALKSAQLSQDQKVREQAALMREKLAPGS